MTKKTDFVMLMVTCNRHTHSLPSWDTNFDTREEAEAYVNEISGICPLHNHELTNTQIHQIRGARSANVSLFS